MLSGWAQEQVAQDMALLPVLAVGLRAWWAGRVEVAHVWLASAYAVSFVADTAVALGWIGGAAMLTVYPVTQTGLIAAVFLPRLRALLVVLGVSLVGVLALALYGPERPDVLVCSVAWPCVVASVWRRPALAWMRWSLLATFGLGWIAWLVHVAAIPVDPHFLTYYAFHACRAIGLLLLCVAILRPRPQLKVILA